MAETLQKTPREISIEKGKKNIVTLVVIFILLEVLLFVVKVLNAQPITFSNIVRFLLTTVAGVYLYKGQKWAKLLLTLGSSLGVLVGVYTLFLAWRNPSYSDLFLVILMIPTAFYAIAAYNLIFSIDIDEYLKILQD